MSAKDSERSKANQEEEYPVQPPPQRPGVDNASSSIRSLTDVAKGETLTVLYNFIAEDHEHEVSCYLTKCHWNVTFTNVYYRLIVK